MTGFRHLSIRQKLLVIVLVTLLVSLLISSAAIGLFNHSVATNEFRDQLQVLVNITAKRSQAALAFRDSRAVRNNLESLSEMSAVQAACVYDQNDVLFSTFERDEKTLTCPRSYAQAEAAPETFVQIQHDIELNAKRLGQLTVFADRSGLHLRLLRYIQVTAMVILISIIVAYALSMRLQRALTLPIIRLSALAEKISKTHDFSLRARVYNQDEAGRLAESFNALINNIQDSQLQMQELVLELQEKTQQLESHTELVEDRNKVIRNMFSGAAHDLKQPLQAMALFVNALRERVSDAKQMDLLRKLELSIQNMKTLFEDLLDVSKLENRLENVQRGPVELRPLLDNVFQEFDALAGDKKLSLRFHATDVVIDSNARMLERIIRNLLSNAIRYTVRGGILLACRERAGGVSIEIWDTGLGIPEESMERIFKRFYQVENHSSESTQGYGLGLSIVKRLSELLKHPIEVKSRFGRGTLFRVQVPVYEDQGYKNEILAPQPVPSAAEPAAPIKHLPGEELRVLLIDDDDLVREALRDLLEGWRMQVTDFDSIAAMRAAIEASEDLEFDVIVSDFQLSDTENGLDAIACANDLLQQQGGDEVPALIVTGTDDEALIKQIKDAGVRMLKKPVKAAKLRALINHLVKD